MDSGIAVVRTAGGPSFWRARKLAKTVAPPAIKRRAAAKRMVVFRFMLPLFAMQWESRSALVCGANAQVAIVLQKPKDRGAGCKFLKAPLHEPHCPSFGLRFRPQ